MSLLYPRAGAADHERALLEKIRQRTLLDDYSLEIGAGLGPMAGKIWRIGLMGHASNIKNVLLCLSALDDALTALGAPIEPGLAIAAARKSSRQATEPCKIDELGVTV